MAIWSFASGGRFAAGDRIGLLMSCDVSSWLGASATQTMTHATAAKCHKLRDEPAGTAGRPSFVRFPCIRSNMGILLVDAVMFLPFSPAAIMP
jgi:hypothetical protein